MRCGKERWRLASALHWGFDCTWWQCKVCTAGENVWEPSVWWGTVHGRFFSVSQATASVPCGVVVSDTVGGNSGRGRHTAQGMVRRGTVCWGTARSSLGLALGPLRLHIAVFWWMVQGETAQGGQHAVWGMVRGTAQWRITQQGTTCSSLGLSLGRCGCTLRHHGG